MPVLTLSEKHPPASSLSLMSCWTDLPKIDVSPVNVYKCKLHSNPVADIKSLETMDHSPFDRDREKPGPGAFFRSPGNDGIELLPNSVFQQHCRRRFPDLSFDFICGVFFFRAMFRQGLKLIIAIRQGTFSYRTLQQALCDKVGIPAIRGCGMGIVPHRETKVSRGSVSRKFCNVFTGSHKFDHSEGEVGESNRVGCFLPGQEFLQGF